jgi:hypothetical protein
MNSEVLLRNIVRGIGILVLQILVIKQMAFGFEGFGDFTVFLYPIILMLLPVSTLPVVALGVAFCMGIILDIFYDSMGVHAGACVFTAYFRVFLLQIMEPRGGYSNDSASKKAMGLGWFLQYAAILLFAHLLVYFAFDMFAFRYAGQVFLRTLASLSVSMILIIIYQVIFDPR